MRRVLIAGFAAALLAGSQASAADSSAVMESCVKSTNWSDKACQCLAKKSESLSPIQRDYVVALIAEDEAGQTKAEGELSVTQFADVSTFMVNAGPDCQGD